jgi:predicted transcriptional regulator of viral defense system
MDNPDVMESVQRMKGVCREVPGARLTVTDAARVSGLDHQVCAVVLSSLEEAGFERATDGRYRRHLWD